MKGNCFHFVARILFILKLKRPQNILKCVIWYVFFVSIIFYYCFPDFTNTNLNANNIFSSVKKLLFENCFNYKLLLNQKFLILLFKISTPEKYNYYY